MTEKETKLDETVPGGRYLVDGEWRDANGKEVKGPAKAKKADEPPPAEKPEEPAGHTDAAPTTEAMAEMLNQSVASLKEALADVSDLGVLHTLHDMEAGADGGGRKGALSAIDSRIEEVESGSGG